MCPITESKLSDTVAVLAGSKESLWQKLIAEFATKPLRFLGCEKKLQNTVLDAATINLK